MDLKVGSNANKPKAFDYSNYYNNQINAGLELVTQATEKTANFMGKVDKMSSSALDQFENLGKFVKKMENYTAKLDIPSLVFSTTTNQAALKDSMNELYLDGVESRTKGVPSFDREFADRHFPSEFKPSTTTKVLSKAGEVLDGVTGVLDMAKSFAEDRQNADKSYKGTFTSMISSVGQISATSAAGVFVGSATLALGGGVAAVVLAGTGAAMLAGYGMGKLMDFAFGRNVEAE